jgi:hypothetical protein
VNEVVIQEFIAQDAMEQQQVEVAQSKLKAFEVELPRSE